MTIRHSGECRYPLPLSRGKVGWEYIIVYWMPVFTGMTVKTLYMFMCLKKIINFILLILLLFICMPFQGSAEVYKWVDEQGQMHYGEKPPAANATEVKIQNAPGADESVLKRNEESDKLLKVYEEERNIRNEEIQKAEEEERKRAEECMIAENELKDMQQEGLLYYDLDDKGERKILSDTELKQRTKELQEQYNLHCQ